MSIMKQKGGENMEVLDRIIDLLIAESKEQQQLSDYLGLKKSVVTDWKSGKSHSYMKYLNPIATFLDVPIDTFYCSDEQYFQYKRTNLTSDKKIESEFDKAYPKNSDQTANELLNAYFTLSIKNKAKVLTFVSELAENQDN